MSPREHKTYCAVFWERDALESDGYRIIDCQRVGLSVKSVRFVHVWKQEVKILEFSLEHGWYVLMNDKRQTLKRWQYEEVRQS